jgi:hypothetical protein
LNGKEDLEFYGKAIAQSVGRYQDLGTEKTTDARRRAERQQEFIRAIKQLPEGNDDEGTPGDLPFGVDGGIPPVG